MKKFKEWCKEWCVFLGFLYLLVLISLGLYLDPYGDIKVDLKRNYVEMEKAVNMLRIHEDALLFMDDKLKKAFWRERNDTLRNKWIKEGYIAQ